MLIIETLVNYAKSQPGFRINDGLTSISAGIFSRLPMMLRRSLEVSAYIYVWNNYRILEMPWDSPWTWWLTFLGVDFAYYWVHRFSHEVNIMWAAHQAHHSSEDYNLSTALRQSVMNQYLSWLFYLPMALVIPPSVFAVHIQFNLIYQFWIHTETVGNLGPLEFVINTPSHHRVHHGRNPYCIDKNYGGTLIIWDRIFGTFAPESEKVVYGLTHPIDTFDPFWVQFHHYTHIWKTFWATPGISNKLSVIFKGPGWGPGKPRLGLPEELPEITGKEVLYNPALPASMQAYALMHFLLIVGIYHEMFASKAVLSETVLVLNIIYVLLTLTAIGFISNQKCGVALLEPVRCIVFLVFHRLGYLKLPSPVLTLPSEVICLLTMCYWMRHMVKKMVLGKKKHH
ncbi:alkylglycerol monooxygenase isoform X2 [Erpetoichthys calabaricus]|nr:alkylglycerol monooxygenase isoform X2 [Erpetoichthys calabaricus]